MGGESSWLVATAGLSAVMLGGYIWGIIKHQKPFDLNLIVPLLLGCAGSVAAVKMIVLAFTLPRQVVGTPVASLIDSASIFVGGVIFFLTALYGSIQIVYSAFSSIETNKSNGDTDVQ